MPRCVLKYYQPHTQTHYEKPIKNLPIHRAAALHINRLAFRILLIFDGITFTNNDHTHTNTHTHYENTKHKTQRMDKLRHMES